MSILYLIFYCLSAIILFFLLFPFLTVLASFLKRENLWNRIPLMDYDFGVVITAYRNVAIAQPLVESLLRQSHPFLHIYLVADASEPVDFPVKDARLTVLFPASSLNLKVKSIIYAVERFVKAHDYTVIFDADNLAHPDFLKELNRYANAGFRAIQGQRTAKNLDTLYACADALGEFYKNYVERYVPYLLKSSTVISGSGMGVETDLYKSYLYGPEIQQGKELWKKMLQEDKILQNHLLFHEERIVYAKNALVYDEKVSSGDAVTTQRSRWLFSYFQNLKNSSRLLWQGVAGFNWNMFLFGLITIAPPLFILVFAALGMTVLGLFFNMKVSLALLGGMMIFAGNIFLCLYLSKAPREIWQAIWALPLFIGKQVIALFRMSNPDKNFKHSEHTKNISIDELLKK